MKTLFFLLFFKKYISVFCLLQISTLIRYKARKYNAIFSTFQQMQSTPINWNIKKTVHNKVPTNKIQPVNWTLYVTLYILIGSLILQK